MSQAIENKLDHVRGKLGLVSALNGASMIVGAALVMLACGMLLDWLVELPALARAAWLAAIAALAGYLLVKHIFVPLTYGPDDDHIALMVERHEPRFQNRLIAAVQLSRPDALVAGASAAFIDALIIQAEELAQGVNFGSVVKVDRLMKNAGAASFILLASIAAFIWGGQSSRDLLSRAFMGDTPVPRKTQVVIQNGDRFVAKGDNIMLDAEYAGVDPGADAKVRITYAGGGEAAFDLKRDSARPSRYFIEVANVQESFKYTIHLNDGRSAPFSATVLDRPALATLRCTQAYPAYTRLEPQARSAGDLTILAGSTLAIEAVPAEKATGGIIILRSGPLDRPVEKRIPMTLRKDGVLVGQFIVEPDAPTPADAPADAPSPADGPSSDYAVVPSTRSFSVHLVNEIRGKFKIESRDDAVYRIEAAVDREPVVRMSAPQKDQLVTQQATVPVEFDASDDYGLGKLILHWQVEGAAEQSSVLESFNQIPRSAHRLVNWEIGKLSPLVPEGSTVTYWVEARDLNNLRHVDGGSGLSEKFTVRVVSRDQWLDAMNQRTSDSMGQFRHTTDAQEELTDSFGNLILRKPATRPATAPAR